MSRSSALVASLTLLACSGVLPAGMVSGTISPAALYIQSRPYRELSTGNTIGAITSVQKASGIVPTVGAGLVCWADGRGGEVVIMGYDLRNTANLADPSHGEFIISAFGDGWQEGNPWVGYDSAGGNRQVAYDSVQINPAVPAANRDQGDIQGSVLPPSPAWLVQKTGVQLTPVTTAYGSESVLAWTNRPGTPSTQFPGYTNTEIYIRRTSVPGVDTHITAGSPAPREHLCGNNTRLAWQELRYDETNDVTSWDIGVYDLQTSSVRYLDGLPATPGKNQIQPDLAGRLLVYTQEEDPAGTKATNIYFQDLDNPNASPLAVTTTGTAMKPAVSKVLWGSGASAVESYFVVWQDHRGDNTKSSYAGGNGETDYNWDIWGQEIRLDQLSGQYALYLSPFLIHGDAGRQTNPDIDGFDVTWQSQNYPGVNGYNFSENIYVWGALIPEPGSLGILTAGAVLAAIRRRRTPR